MRRGLIRWNTGAVMRGRTAGLSGRRSSRALPSDGPFGGAQRREAVDLADWCGFIGRVGLRVEIAGRAGSVKRRQSVAGGGTPRGDRRW